ncbi:MAG: metal-dependent hydrolase [Candidatus Saccharimonadales bacterium]
MTARTHDVAALSALVGWVIAMPPGNLTVATALAAVLANQLGGIAPDIDQPTAPFWRNLPIGRYFGRVFGALVGGHRFFCHSILGLAVFGVGVMALLQFLQPIMPHIDIDLVWLAFMIGMVSHLIMDTTTKEGVPWLLPLPYKFGLPPLRRFRITTGSWVENLVVLPLLIALTTWLCAQNYTDLATVLQNRLIR